MASTVTSTGLRNMMVVAVASGVVRMPALKKPVVDIRNTERNSCCLGCLLTASCRIRGPQATMPTMVAKKNRAQVTCTSE